MRGSKVASVFGKVFLLRELYWVCLDTGVNEGSRIKKQEIFTSGGLVCVLNLEFLFQTQDPQPRLKRWRACAHVGVYVCMGEGSGK